MLKLALEKTIYAFEPENLDSVPILSHLSVQPHE